MSQMTRNLMDKTRLESLHKLTWFAFLTALISLCGLLSLLLIPAYAQNDDEDDEDMDTPNGFERGDRVFTNPFADVPQPDNAAPPPPAFPPPGAPGGNAISVNPPGNAKAQDSVPEPKMGSTGIQVGGEPPGGVISAKPPTFDIDIESGAGSKAMITDFNYPDAEVLDIAKTLGKLTGKNFVYDKNVKGRITIVANSPITVGDAWKAFLTALDINNFALVPSGPFIRITRKRDARDKQVTTYTGDVSPDSDALITRIFPLKYLSAEEVARTLRSFIPADARIIPYPQTNTVIVTDNGANITKLAKMLEFMDIEGFDAGIVVIPVKYASAAELAKLIDQLLPGTGGAAGRRATTPGIRSGMGSFESRKTKEGGVINTIIADERTNTLIVHANTKGAEQVRELIRKLDVDTPAQVGGGRIHVIYLHFADAEELAKTLTGFSSGASKSSAPRSGGGGAPTTGVNPAKSSEGLFEGSVKITADKATNSLVVVAAPADYVTLQRVVNRLDIPRDQVYVEAIIMEITLGNDFKFSANSAFLTPLGVVGFTPGTDLIDFFTNPLSQKGLVLGGKSGDKYSKDWSANIGGQKVEVNDRNALITALQTYAKANVLATPQIMTLDNTEAEFNSSERLPIPSTTTSNQTTTAGINYEEIGLKMKIKPQINKLSDFVTMEISSKLDDISSREPPAQVRELAFATIVREAKTNVVVADSDTVVIGGLIRDKRNEIQAKVPLLGDIPILGWLFRSEKSEVIKTNLLIFITPHIVKQYEKVRAILDKKLMQRDSFIENNAGGDDPLRAYRDDIIRELPDMNEIAAKAAAAENPVTPTKDQESVGGTLGGSSDESSTQNAPPLDESAEDEEVPEAAPEDIPPPPEDEN